MPRDLGAYRFHATCQVNSRIYREPAVAIFSDALWNPFRLGAHQHRRPAGLCRLGPAPCRLEIHKVAVILGYVLRPDFFHGEDPLARNFPAVLKVNAVIGHLFGIPSGADAEQESPV